MSWRASKLPPPREPLPLLIHGLVAELPGSEGARWTAAERDKWLEMASAAFDLLYEMTPLDVSADVSEVVVRERGQVS